MSGNNEQIQVFQQKISNFEIFSHVLREYNIELQQLDRGAFSANLQQIQCGHVFINRFTATRRLEALGHSPLGLKTFGVPTNRCLPFTWRNKFSTGNTIQIYKPGSELEMITHPFFEAIDVSITEEFFNVLLQRWELPELDEIINNREMVSCHPVNIQPLRTTLHSVCTTLDNHPGLFRRSPVIQNIIHFEVPYLLAQALMFAKDQLTRSTTDKRHRILKAALKYIKKTPQKLSSFNNFSRETGINERTLQRAFLDQYGVSPKSYSKAYHLNNVYKTLVSSHPESTTICEVASHFGFTHMSQFARDYRDHFAELPSETLNKVIPKTFN